jgi:hypothetical protein
LPLPISTPITLRRTAAAAEIHLAVIDPDILLAVFLRDAEGLGLIRAHLRERLDQPCRIHKGAGSASLIGVARLDHAFGNVVRRINSDIMLGPEIGQDLRHLIDQRVFVLAHGMRFHEGIERNEIGLSAKNGRLDIGRQFPIFDLPAKFIRFQELAG